MGNLLKAVGAILASFGLVNIILMLWTESSGGLLTVGIFFNILLFVIPGLIVYGIGAGIVKRKKASTEALTSESTGTPSNLTVEKRLHELNSLKEKGHVNESEYERRRAKMLNEV